MAVPRRYTPEQYQQMATNAVSERARGSNMDGNGCRRILTILALVPILVGGACYLVLNGGF